MEFDFFEDKKDSFLNKQQKRSKKQSTVASYLTGRTPPHQLETERAVLGAILVQNQALDELREMSLEPEDFYLEAHRKIYQVTLDLFEKRQPVDLVTLSSALKDQNWFEEVGGIETLTRLFDESFAVGNVSSYAKIVKEKSTLRKMIHACNAIIEKAFTTTENTEIFLDEAEKKIFEIAHTTQKRGMRLLRTVLLENIAQVEELAVSRKEVTGLETGFRDFDFLTTGLHPGQVIIVAARPGMGKTSWLISAIEHASVELKAVVAFFSLEMSQEELGFRFLSSLARIDSRKLKTGKLDQQGREFERLTEAADKLSKAKIFIDDSGGLTIMDIRSRCRRLLAQEKKLDLIVVDYLQLMQGSKRTSGREWSREREISDISRSLKELSKELKVPLIALSQLNRGVESRQDKRPVLADLRESGSIEQDADIVCFIHRDDYYDRESENKGIADFIIAKNRSGEIRTIRFAWIPQYTLFSNLSKEDPMADMGSFRSEKGDAFI